MLADSSLTSGGGVWMAIAMLCAVSLILTQIRRAHARRPGREQFVQQQMDRLSDAREMRHSCDDMVVRLEDTSRRICAEIDTRFAQLECAVAEARARAAQLEALLAELRESGVAAPPPVSFDPAGHDAAARGPGDGVRAERGPVDGSRVCSGPADGRRGRTGVDDEPPSAGAAVTRAGPARSDPTGSTPARSTPARSSPVRPWLRKSCSTSRPIRPPAPTPCGSVSTPWPTPAAAISTSPANWSCRWERWS